MYLLWDVEQYKGGYYWWVTINYPGGSITVDGDNETEPDTIASVNQAAAQLWRVLMDIINAEEPHPEPPTMTAVTDQPQIPQLIRVRRTTYNK